MRINLSTERTYTEGPDLTINCPSCCKQDIIFTTQETLEKSYLLFFIPLSNVKFLTVRCTNCQKKLSAYLSLDQIESMNDKGIEIKFLTSISLIIKSVIVIGACVAIFPIIGLLVNIIAFACVAKEKLKWRTTSILALVFSVLLAILCVFIVLFSNEPL